MGESALMEESSKKNYGVGFTTKIIILVKRYTNEKYWRASVLFLFNITWKFLHIQYYNTCLLRILVQDPFLIFVNNPKQSLHARNSFKDILKKDYQKVK